MRLDDGSRMSREAHVRFCESRGVRFPPATHLVVLVHGTRAHVEALREETAAVLRPMGLRLSEAKTRIAHVDEGFDFLGFRIRRAPKRGSGKLTVYTYPSKGALASVKAKVRAATREATNQPLATLCFRLAPMVRGWVNYFRHGVSKATFDYLREFTWRRVICWLRHKHRRASWKWLLRRYLPRWWPTDGKVTLFDPMSVPVTRYRYRGNSIPSPWQERDDRDGRVTQGHDLVESRMRGNAHVRFGGAGQGIRPPETEALRPGPTPTSSG